MTGARLIGTFFFLTLVVAMLTSPRGRHTEQHTPSDSPARTGSQPLPFPASVCASLSLKLASARVPSRAASSCLSLSSSLGVLFAAEQPAEDIHLTQPCRRSREWRSPPDRSCCVTLVLLLNQRRSMSVGRIEKSSAMNRRNPRPCPLGASENVVAECTGRSVAAQTQQAGPACRRCVKIRRVAPPRLCASAQVCRGFTRVNGKLLAAKIVRTLCVLPNIQIPRCRIE